MVFQLRVFRTYGCRDSTIYSTLYCGILFSSQTLLRAASESGWQYRKTAVTWGTVLSDYLQGFVLRSVPSLMSEITIATTVLSYSAVIRNLSAAVVSVVRLTTVTTVEDL